MKKEDLTIVKNDDHVLFTDANGAEYHLSNEEFNRLGETRAREYVKEELERKKATFTGDVISYDKARDLGFCEYGIKDFCNALGLDIKKEYKINDLKSMLTLDILTKYPSEIIKVLGIGTLDKFGGVDGLLNNDEVSAESRIKILTREEFIHPKILHKFGVACAYKVLHHFENEFPDDKRPRTALEVKTEWIAAKFP
jgi:hypothetical protein